MQVFIGADYRGYNLKQQILEVLASKGYNVSDMGTFNPQEVGDFNDPAVDVAKAVRECPGSFGVLVCDSAHGVTMQANRFKGIRAANCDNVDSAKLAREHDDANIVCLSAHFLMAEIAGPIVLTFLDTPFKKLERRVRRINRLDEREDYD